MRLKFQNILESDFKLQVREWRNLDEVRKYMYNDAIISQQEHLMWVENLKNDNKNRFFIVLFDDIPIGAASLNNINFKFKSSDWAFYIFDETAKAKGLGSAIEAYFLDYVFFECELEKLNCEVIAFNEAVVKLHQKFGFQIEGIKRQNIIKNGTRHDVVMLGILKSEWLESKPRLQKIIDRIVS